MLPIVEWEGYSDETYLDTVGVKTKGVGQTGVFLNMSYPTVFRLKKNELLRYTPWLETLPARVQDALLVSNYRGDWGQSPKARKLFSKGDFFLAAVEYLDNEDYKQSTGQLRERFIYVAKAIASLEDS